LSDYYALSYEIVVKTGTSVPRREYELIEFYKVVKRDPRNLKIIGVEFDEEGHMVIFHVIPKEVRK